MTDIAERLRAAASSELPSYDYQLLTDAAASEIERLRVALSRCASCGYPRQEHTYNGACYGICGEFVDAAATPGVEEDKDDEIARLQMLVRDKDAEIERLRMERDVVCRDAAADIKSLRAEIERLRAMLAEYESAPVRLRHIGEHTEYTQGVHDRLRHIMKHGAQPDGEGEARGDNRE